MKTANVTTLFANWTLALFQYEDSCACGHSSKLIRWNHDHVASLVEEQLGLLGIDPKSIFRFQSTEHPDRIRLDMRCRGCFSIRRVIAAIEEATGEKAVVKSEFRKAIDEQHDSWKKVDEGIYVADGENRRQKKTALATEVSNAPA